MEKHLWMYNLKERHDWGQGILWGYTYYQKAMFISFKFSINHDQLIKKTQTNYCLVFILITRCNGAF